MAILKAHNSFLKANGKILKAGGGGDRLLLHTICNNCVGNVDIPLVGNNSELLTYYKFLNPGYRFLTGPMGTTIVYPTNQDVRKYRLKCSLQSAETYGFIMPFGRVEYHDFNDSIYQLRGKTVFRLNDSGQQVISSDFAVINEGISKHYILPITTNEVFEISTNYNEPDGELTVMCKGQKAVIRTNMTNGPILARLYYGRLGGISRVYEVYCST